MYRYATEKPKLFTDEGQKTFLKVRDNTHRLIKEAGACNMEKAALSIGGDTWQLMACVDRMVELGEIREIHHECAGQHRVFVGSDF